MVMMMMRRRRRRIALKGAIEDFLQYFTAPRNVSNANAQVTEAQPYDRQADRQTDRQTGRQTNRQTDR